MRPSLARRHLARSVAAAAVVIAASAVVQTSRAVPTYGASDDGPSVLLSGADGDNPYSGVVRYFGRATCTGVFLDTVRDEDAAAEAPAYVLTNGHCPAFPGSNEVFVGRTTGITPGRVVFNFFADTRDRQFGVNVAHVEYATMKGGDVAVLRLAARHADIVERGFRPWSAALALPRSDEPVVVVGAPLQADSSRAFLRLAACRLGGRAPVVLEYIWHWFDFWRNSCADIQPGSSGSPVISRVTGQIVGLLNTTTAGGRPPYTECGIDHPCEPTIEAAESLAETNYATPAVGLGACFDSAGVFDLQHPGCPLDPGKQPAVSPSVLGYQNPGLAGAPIGVPRTRWDVRVQGAFDYYRYKTGVSATVDCRDLRGYSAPRRASERPIIDDPLPRQDGRYFLCVVGGSSSRWGAAWQSVDVPMIVTVTIDTIPPRIEAPVSVTENEIAYRVNLDQAGYEISNYMFKSGRPSDTFCGDPSGYRLALLDFVSLPKSGRPYLFCAAPFDAAGNPGRVVELLLP